MNSPGVTPQRCPLCVGGFHEIGGRYRLCPYCGGNGCIWPGQDKDKTDRLIADIINGEDNQCDITTGI